MCRVCEFMCVCGFNIIDEWNSAFILSSVSKKHYLNLDDGLSMMN